MSDTNLTALIDALGSFGIKVQAVPPVVTQPPPTLPSMDGKRIMPSDTTFIIDNNLDHWNVNTGGMIARNGLVDVTTQRVLHLDFIGGVIYQTNADNNTWAWKDNTWVQTNSTQTGGSTPTGSGTTPGTTSTDATVGKWIDGSAAGMNYKLLLPSNYDPSTAYPAVMYLHQLDMGTDWNDLGKWCDNWFNTVAVRNRWHFILIVPLLDQTADPSGNTINFGGVTANVTIGREQAMACLHDVWVNHKMDDKRVYLTGNSLGGIGTWDIIAQYPSMFAAAMPLAGANYYRDPTAVAVLLKDMPIWALHGANDTSVPLQWDRQMNMAMLSIGNKNFRYTELPNMGHDIWDTIYPDPLYLGWLMSQSISNSGTTPLPTPVPPTPTPTPTTTPTGSGLPLSPGFLTTFGNQIIDSQGVKQRIASVGWNQIDEIPQNVAQMRKAGFNCIRVSYVDATIEEDLLRIDQVAVACHNNNMRFIVDHHTCERGTPADGWGSQQKNGKPWDVGPGTDGTNGAGVTGTVTREKWISNWVRVASRYALTDVFIGCDLHNEPSRYGNTTWGDGGVVDLRAAYQDCGNAILAHANPGLLIICEGAQDYNINCPWGDLSVVEKAPVILSRPQQVVYSVHNYPNYVSGFHPDSGQEYMNLMEASFGSIMRKNIAPVWIGEMGANMTDADQIAWAEDTTNYIAKCVNQAGDQPMGTDWWAWGQFDGQQLIGTLKDGQLRPEQQKYWSRLLYSR